jgi:hypothetical protein
MRPPKTARLCWWHRPGRTKPVVDARCQVHARVGKYLSVQGRYRGMAEKRRTPGNGGRDPPGARRRRPRPGGRRRRASSIRPAATRGADRGAASSAGAVSRGPNREGSERERFGNCPASSVRCASRSVSPSARSRSTSWGRWRTNRFDAHAAVVGRLSPASVRAAARSLARRTSATRASRAATNSFGFSPYSYAATWSTSTSPPAAPLPGSGIGRCRAAPARTATITRTDAAATATQQTTWR